MDKKNKERKEKAVYTVINIGQIEQCETFSISFGKTKENTAT